MTDNPPVVVGAGPAGIRAAETLVQAGLRPIVFDEYPKSGGQIYRRPPDGSTRDHDALYGFDAARARRVHGDFDALGERIDFRPETLVFSLRPDTLMTLNGRKVTALPWTDIILATGAMDRVIPFPGWTTPGVFTIGGAQVALKFQGCAVGRKTVFVGTGPLLYLVAYQYAKAGASVAGVFDTAPFGARVRALPDLVWGGRTFLNGLFYVGWLRRRGIPTDCGVQPVRVDGGDAVEGLVYRDGRGREQRVTCDAVAIGFGLKPETQLIDLARVPFVFDPRTRQWTPEHDEVGRTPVRGVYVAGDGAGIMGAVAAELTGERAALALLADRGYGTKSGRIATLNRRLGTWKRFRRGVDKAFPFPADLARAVPDDAILCRCENITAGELRAAGRDLGATEINRAKAFCRVGMGRCQGRVCGIAAAEILAETLSVDVAEVGRLRGQPPVKPVPLATEAG